MTDYDNSKNNPIKKNEMNIINEDVEIKNKISKHNIKDLNSNTSKTFNSDV